MFRHSLPLLLMLLLVLPAAADFVTAPAVLRSDDAIQRTHDYDTDHFRIVLDTDAEDVHQLLATEAEAALADLAPRLHVKLDHRVDLVVYTQTDSYAGYTDILSRRITLSLGVPLEAELHGAPFVRALLRHELVHYLVAHRVETIPGGIGRGLGWVILPMWFHEGICEQFSAPWDTLREIFTRTAHLDGRVGPEQMHLFYYADSLGRRLGYDLAHSFVRFLAERYGPDVFEKVLAETQRLNPRFRRILHKVTGVSAGKLFRDWKEKERNRARETLGDRTGLETRGQVIDSRARISLNPLFSPDGKFLYYASNRDRDYFTFALYRRDLLTGDERKLLGNVHYRFDLSPDGDAIVFSRRQEARRGHAGSDVYRLDLQSGHVRRLTHSRLARNPSWSRDGRKIAFTVVGNARQNVWIMDGTGGNQSRLTDLKAGEAAYSPVFDQDAILFSLRDERGGSSVVSIPLQGGAPTTVFSTGHLVVRPRRCMFSSADPQLRFIVGDGQFLDLAQLLPDGRVQKLTRLARGILDFDISPAGSQLVMSEIHSNGIRLMMVPASCVQPQDELAELDRPAAVELPEAGIIRQRERYDGMPRFRYLVPWADTVSGNPLLGIRAQLLDPAARNRVEVMSLYGANGYHSKMLTATLGGMNPVLGLSLYDVVDEFRPGQNRTFKGGDFFALYRINSRLTLSGRMFRRTLTSNSITPWYALRHPATGDVDGRDAGVASGLYYYHAERSVDEDIHPLNLTRWSARHVRTSRGLNSFYDYRYSRLALDRTLLVGNRRHQIALRGQYGHASGDWDFQFGGPGEFRGYRSRPLAGPRVASMSLEYQFPKLRRGLFTQMLSLPAVYPAVFYDRGAAWRNKADWRGTAGLEFGSRVLLFNKLSVGATWGVARQLDHRRETEFYGQIQLEF